MMAQYFNIHPDNPQRRLLEQAMNLFHSGAIMAFPTNSCYGVGCRIGDKEGVERIQRLRELDKKYHLTLICKDLSEIATYAQVSNAVYRLLKVHTPGPYTFILPASHEVPRRLHHPKKKTIGLRVPTNKILRMMLEILGEPLLSITLSLPGEEQPFTDGETIKAKLGKQLDIIIDGGYCPPIPTTVVDLAEPIPKILRVGGGDPTPFEV
jgi:tRNA threonylcarbamoyl adenosine modification protein (Sua5/YciO/YrdC/YwlC family)